MDQMMYQILAQVHYMPDLWKTHANSLVVREEFVKLFQYKFVSILIHFASYVIEGFRKGSIDSWISIKYIK